MARGIKREVISHCSAIAYDCFDGRGYSDFTVSGKLVKYTLWGFTWYRIKIFKPKVSGMYDGCFMTRAKLKAYANAIRTSLKEKLFEYRYER